MGRDDGDADLLFWDSSEETGSDSEPICEFKFLTSPNPGILMLSFCPPRIDCGLGCQWFAVCERAEWRVMDKVSTVL